MRPGALRKRPESPLGGLMALLERSWGDFGPFRDGPEAKKRGPRKMKTYNLLFWGSFWLHFGHFRLKNRARSENSEMLENDDPYSIFAMFLRPEGSKMRAKCSKNAQK